MYSIERHIHGGDSGVILMETLLSLPIYLILLAGLFWMGELATARSKLMVLDFGNVWAYGVRHGGLSGDELARLVFGNQLNSGSGDFQDIQFLNGGNRSAGSSSAWWREFRTEGEISVTQPDLVNGIARFLNLWSDREEESGLADSSVNTLSMNARNQYKDEFPFTQCLYSRTDQYARRGNRLTGTQLSRDWQSVYGEPFAAESEEDTDSRKLSNAVTKQYVRTTGNRLFWQSVPVTAAWPTPAVSPPVPGGSKPGDCYMFYYTPAP